VLVKIQCAVLKGTGCVLKIEVIRICANPLMFIQRIDYHYIFGRNFKIKDERIFFDTVFV
jgi:hypothetical protein